MCVSLENMKKETLVSFGNVLIFLSIVFSLWLAMALKPSSNTILVIFGSWAIAPYILMAYFVNLKSTTFRQTVGNVVMSCLCCLGGILWEVNITVINSDPQGAFGVLIVPFLQIVAFFVLRSVVVPKNV